MPASTRNLFLCNIAVLVAALWLHWSFGSLLWPYWMQSVIIGWYARKRIATLGAFSVKGYAIDGLQPSENDDTRRRTTNSFAFYYACFHLAYLVFIVSLGAIHSLLDVLVLSGCGVSFVASQRHTYAVQHAADLRGKPNIGTLMFTPFARIVPMHFAMLLSFHIEDMDIAGTTPLIAFAVLKTVADVLLDWIDRRMAINSADKVAAAANVQHRSHDAQVAAAETFKKTD